MKTILASLTVLLMAWSMNGAARANEAPAAPGGGRMIVVDGANPQADDAGPGTEAKPFKTLGQAAKAVRPGDTVCVMEGVYAEKLVIPSSAAGTAARKTVFRSYPRHGATVQGADINAAHVRLEGFKVVDRGIMGRWGDGVEVVDNRLEVKTYGIAPDFQASPRDALVSGNWLFKPQSGFQIHGTNWIVERNEVYTLKQYEKKDSDYSRAFGEGHIIRRNYYHGARMEEIGTAHVDGCQTWHNKGQAGTFLKKVTFEDNVFLNIGQGIIARSTEEMGFLTDITCRRNIFGLGLGDGRNDRGAWAYCLQNVTGLTAENNLMLRTIHGLGLWGDGSAVAKNNITYETGTSLWCSGQERGNTPFPGKFEAHHNIIGGRIGALDPATNLLTDPKFVDAAAGNYRLKPDSPCLRAGEGGTCVGPLAYPNVYAVDPTHPAADDTKFGYPAIPFQTASRAATVAASGETIVLYGGTYRETIAMTKDDVTLRAAPGEKVVISGADLVAGWKRDGDRWVAPLAAKPQRVLRDGQPWDGFRYDAEAKLMVVQGQDPRLHAIETVVREHGLDLGGKKVRVEGLTVVNVTGEPIVGREKATVTDAVSESKKTP
jgi:hypothetical protein